MVYKNIDYIIYYEHVTRELESVKKLKSNLDGLGYEGVILPIHFNRYLNVIKYKPKIVIVPYLYSKKDSTYLRYKNLYGNVKCLNLHSEQISNENTIDYLMPKDEYSKNIFHIAWGEKFARELIKNGVQKDKIFITGSIRNDSIFDYKKIDGESHNILIPTSFSLTMVPDQYINNLEQSMNKDKLERNIKFMRKSRNDFFELIYKAAIKFKEKRFFLRPHPHVDVDTYIKIFKNINNINKLPKNIFIERKGSIQDFFSKGEKIIAWHSTSILEGALMNKKVSILAPIKFPSHMNMDFMEFIKILNSKQELFNFISNKNFKQKSLEDYMHKTFYKIDGLSSLRVSYTVSHILNEINFKNKVGNYKSFSFLMYLFFKSITVDFSKSILQKFGLLDKLFNNYRGIIEDSIEIHDFQEKDFEEGFNTHNKVLFKNTDAGNYISIISRKD